MNRHILLFFAVLSCAAELPAAQRTFVSAEVGSDTNPCTRALPCRSFAAALFFTDANGEVIAVDSGGYGPVTITQSASLISPAGVYAAITATSGNGVTVNAGDTSHVTLRNVSLNGSGGGGWGVDVPSAAAVHVEGCVIKGFFLGGIHFLPATSTSRIYVSDTIVRQIASEAIFISAGTGVIDSTLVQETSAGIDVRQGAQVTVRNSEVANALDGFIVSFGGKMMIEKSAVSNSTHGFNAEDGLITLSRCIARSNVHGLTATSGASAIFVSDSTITMNQTGVDPTGGTAVIASRGNNRLLGNTNNGAFTTTYSSR